VGETLKIYTADEVASLLKVDYKTVLRLIKRGLLKAIPGKVEEAGESPHCKGRWWGIVARQNIPWGERVVVECTDEQAITLMQVLRRYVLGKAKRKFRCNHQSMNYLVNDPTQWERFVKWALGVQNNETPLRKKSLCSH
jgi:hypothetical protein